MIIIIEKMLCCALGGSPPLSVIKPPSYHLLVVRLIRQTICMCVISM